MNQLYQSGFYPVITSNLAITVVFQKSYSNPTDTAGIYDNYLVDIQDTWRTDYSLIFSYIRKPVDSLYGHIST